MLGGASDPSAMSLTDAEAVAVARAELTQVMGIAAAPRLVRVVRQPNGIPQYSIGHPDRLAAIDAALATHPGLLVAGNSYRGVSVNACLDEAPRIATAAWEFAAAANPRDGMFMNRPS